MTRNEKITLALSKINKGIKEVETLGAFSVSRKAEIAENVSKLAYGILVEMHEEIKDMRTLLAQGGK